MTARRWKIAGALAFLGIALTACSSGEVAANDLEVGDCVETQSDLTSADVEAIDCDEDHGFELIGKFDVDDADEFPGDDALQSEGQERCSADIFTDYIGSDFDPSGDVLVAPIVPSEETWDQADDRTILCFAFPSDQSQTTGSLAG